MTTPPSGFLDTRKTQSVTAMPRSIGSSVQRLRAGFYEHKDELFLARQASFAARHLLHRGPVGGCARSLRTRRRVRSRLGNPSGPCRRRALAKATAAGGVQALLCPDGCCCENAAVATIAPGAPRGPRQTAVPKALARSAPAPRCPLSPLCPPSPPQTVRSAHAEARSR